MPTRTAYSNAWRAGCGARADGDVLMCHPAGATATRGRPDRAGAGDRIEVLGGDTWPRLLAQAGVTVGRFAPRA